MVNGTASVIVSEEMFDKLLCEKGMIFLRTRYWGESKYYVIIEHPSLPEGYNGVMVAYYDKDELKFKKDEDT